MTEDVRHTDATRELMVRNFGNIGGDQVRHVAAREFPAPHPPVIVEVAARTWMIQPGMANVALFETDDGLLLVDTGSAGDGPALRDAVRRCSDKPLRYVVFTHAHSDHAYGLWSLLDAGERPTVVAHENILGHYARYTKTGGLNAAINGQLPGRTAAPGRARPRTSSSPT